MSRRKTPPPLTAEELREAATYAFMVGTATKPGGPATMARAAQLRDRLNLLADHLDGRAES